MSMPTAALSSLFALIAVVAATHPIDSPDRLSAHEWGTFTTVAGPDGRATNWLPLGGPTDLPCFVEHFQDLRLLKVIPGLTQPIDYASVRARLWGKVRMETPVIYFYAPREMDVDVSVRFPRGWMTEWYPHASVAQPYITGSTLGTATHTSTIEWKGVRLSPSARATFPTGNGESHYYAARGTEATPLRVEKQWEKFLFYRGVADFDVPLAASIADNGAVRITNLASDTLPAVVLFEKRGDKLGYRIHRSLTGSVTLDAPTLNGSFEALHSDLERMLIGAGLWPREAAAMVDTWRDSWFEEGMRVFYIVPRATVDAILPLEIKPAPDNVARVFVGRMDVLTPHVIQTVEQAIARNDQAALAHHARLLGPVSERILAKTTDAATTARIREFTNNALRAYVRRAEVCE
ncbi:MAG TPA: hypothetical protein VIP11_07650 [Gemmatimonadaceae bacterium]